MPLLHSVSSFILHRITRSGCSWSITPSRCQCIAAIARAIGYRCL